MTFHPFNPPRSVTEYLGQAGAEPNGLALPWHVLDAHAAAVNTWLPEEFVVVGYDEPTHQCRQAGAKRCMDPCPEAGTIVGPRRLRFDVNRAFVEATTSYRSIEGRMRLVCPVCEQRDGRHSKTCTA